MRKILQAFLVAAAAAGVMLDGPTASAVVLSCSRECVLDEVCACRHPDSRFSRDYGGVALLTNATGRTGDIIMQGAAPALTSMNLVGFSAIGLQADGSRSPGCLVSDFGQGFVVANVFGQGPTCDTAVTLIVHIAVDE